MNVTERHVETFRTVMLTRSVTRAAEQLRTSQPTTSRMLAEFEQSVGFRLFIRDRKGMIPTPEATALFEEVLAHFVGLERIVQAARRIGRFDGRTLRIAAIPSASFGLLPLAVSAFRAEHPGVTMTIEVRTYDAVVHNVLSAQCDIGFTAYPLARPGLCEQPILRAAAVCVMKAGDPLANREVVFAEDLEGRDFVSLESLAPSRQRIDRVFSERGVKRQLVIETQNGAAVCALVKHGAGITVMDPFSALSFGGPDLVIKPFEPLIEFVFNVLWRDDRPPTLIAMRFLDVLRAIIGERIEDLFVLESLKLDVA